MSFTALRHLDALVRKRKPIQCTVFLTRKCNARCRFCFYLAGKHSPGAGEELSLAELEKIAAGCGDLLWLAFSGGEVFLRPDLVEIVRAFYARCRPVFILLPSNGLQSASIRRQTEAILQACPESVVTVKLSLDGPPDLHNALRGVERAYDRVQETCRLLAGLRQRYSNFELGINTVCCAANQDRLAEVIEAVRRLPVTTHTVSLVRGDLRQAELKEVCLATYEAAATRLAADLRQGGEGRYTFRGGTLKAAQDIVQRRLIRETARQGRQLIPCYAGRLTTVVTETGVVYPCESFTPAMELGRLRETGYDLPALLESDRARQVLDAIRKKACFCTHECYCMMNILFNPRLYPALAREYLSLIRGSARHLWLPAAGCSDQP